jgi:hypothetical protein
MATRKKRGVFYAATFAVVWFVYRDISLLFLPQRARASLGIEILDSVIEMCDTSRAA